MSKPTKIPPSEWEIMEVLWGQSPLSAAEVLERVGPTTSWSVKTVRALLARLLQKKVISRRTIHGTYVFDPAVCRGDCLQMESQSFIDRFFQGNSISLIAHLLKEKSLSDTDLQRLRSLLEQCESRDAGVSPARLAGILPASGEDGLTSSSGLAHGTHSEGVSPARHADRMPAPRSTPAPRKGRQP